MSPRPIIVKRSITRTVVPPDQTARYFPFFGNRYDTRPNLFKLGHDFGNGKIDGRILQFDSTAQKYLRQKKVSGGRHLGGYYLENLFSPEYAGTVNRFLVNLMTNEYPDYFTKTESGDEFELACHLSGDLLGFDSRCRYLRNHSGRPYVTGLDAIAHQIQEDICVMLMNQEPDKLIAAHLSFPNRWSLAEKLGCNFGQIHRPVAGFFAQNPNAASMLDALYSRGPYVRFAWGLSSDNELDHHPDVARPISFRHGFDPLYLRVERQTLTGLPREGLLIFFIRTYYYDCHEVCSDQSIAHSLLQSILSMKPDTLKYKGLSESREAITGWLESSLKT